MALRPPTDKQRRGTNLALMLSTAGLELGVAVALGVFAGHYLDQKFETTPWFTIALLLLGLAAGFRNLLRLSQRVVREQFDNADHDESPTQPPTSPPGEPGT